MKTSGSTERFETTFSVPGFGVHADAVARVVAHVVGKAHLKGIHVLSLVVERGRLVLKGHVERAVKGTAMLELGKEIDVLANPSFALAAGGRLLPRSAEEAS